MRILHTNEPAGRKALAAMIGRATNLERYDAVVRPVIQAVRETGDTALRACAQRWDGLQPGQPLAVHPAEMAEAWKRMSPAMRKALRRAERNIRTFCQWQMPKTWMKELEPGVRVGQKVEPLASVGCYVPGGRYPLPSTLLMTVIPAQVAGVKEIVVVSPRPQLETLAAAAMLGVKKFYRIGGAQAIAALAYGTKTVPRMDKIVGPGNSFVTAAKRSVAFDCAVDMLAGPTEALILADSGDAGWIAADLVAQAEHDEEAMSVFVTSKKKLGEAVATDAMAQAAGNEIATQALRRNGVVFITKNRKEAIAVADAIASEHVTVVDGETKGITAGSMFLGAYSAQAFGDYCAGPNHVLPTGGAARFRGGLSVCDFVKVVSVQRISKSGARSLAPFAVHLAEAEGLSAHAGSARARSRC